jgi:hypothetical protein
MEVIRLNIANDLRLKQTKLSQNAIVNKEILQPIDKIYFVICNSCYWCASYFGIDDLESLSQVLRCHLCNSCNTELIPISSSESFKINYNVTRGMEMEFYRRNEIVDRNLLSNK